MAGRARIGGLVTQDLNLLGDWIIEADAECDCVLGKPLGRLVGANDAGIIQVPRLLGQNAALRPIKFSRHDRISRSLRRAGGGSTERPAAQVERRF
jgi:hypothetical protein